MNPNWECETLLEDTLLIFRNLSVTQRRWLSTTIPCEPFWILLQLNNQRKNNNSSLQECTALCPTVEKWHKSDYELECKSAELQEISMDCKNTHERAGSRTPGLCFLSIKRDYVKWNIDPIPDPLIQRHMKRSLSARDVCSSKTNNKASLLRSDLAQRWRGGDKDLKITWQRRRSWRSISSSPLVILNSFSAPKRTEMFFHLKEHEASRRPRRYHKPRWRPCFAIKLILHEIRD